MTTKKVVARQCLYYCVLEALLCDRPFIFPLFDDLGTYCLFGADVTQTYKCLTMIIFVRGFCHRIITQLKCKYFIHSPGQSVESIYYQSAQHVLACPDFWAIL